MEEIPVKPSPSSSISAQSALNSDTTHNISHSHGILRYLAFFGRISRIIKPLQRSIRYLAYSSDIGEAFRPVVHRSLVRFCYGISWAYVFSDTGYQTYICYKHARENDQPTSIVYRTSSSVFLFHILASIALPALIIHTSVSQAVKFAHNRFSTISSSNLIRYFPSAIGLLVIPILPFILDQPTEHAIVKFYDKIWPLTSLNKIT